MSTGSKPQRERNSLIVQLFKSGRNQTDLARQFKIAPTRVGHIIATTDRLEQHRANLEAKYGAHPNIEALADNTPIDVLVLCNATFHGWSMRVTNLQYTSLKVRTLGDLRQITDAQLLLEPSIGRRMVAQLRLFCPFREHRARGVRKEK